MQGMSGSRRGGGREEELGGISYEGVFLSLFMAAISVLLKSEPTSHTDLSRSAGMSLVVFLRAWSREMPVRFN